MRTTGPWKIVKQGFTYCIFTADEKSRIATVEGTPGLGGNSNDNQANAQLIAITPELLKAAKAVCACYEIFDEFQSRFVRGGFLKRIADAANIRLVQLAKAIEQLEEAIEKAEAE